MGKESTIALLVTPSSLSACNKLSCSRRQDSFPSPILIYIFIWQIALQPTYLNRLISRMRILPQRIRLIPPLSMRSRYQASPGLAIFGVPENYGFSKVVGHVSLWALTSTPGRQECMVTISMLQVAGGQPPEGESSEEHCRCNLVCCNCAMVVVQRRKSHSGNIVWNRPRHSPIPSAHMATFSRQLFCFYH